MSLANDKYINIIVIYAVRARVVHEVTLCVAADCTLRQALARSGLLEDIVPSERASLNFSVWGRKALLDQVLRDDDRVELCRPLRVDPKVARRERFLSQGAKTAGLFASRRKDAKAGY